MQRKMNLIYTVIDYFMDFHKVRNFQNLCGLKEVKNNTIISDSLANETSTSSFKSDKKKECKALNYEITNRLLHQAFLLGSVLGTEVFYITVIPFLMWNFDEYIARKVIVVWVVTMYIGQAAKDLIKWPRPTSPPAFKLEKRVAAEYGLPSTHAIAGTSIPFAMFITSLTRYHYPVILGFIFASCWSLLVSLSRIYVGMHSFMDIIAGNVISFVYLIFGHPFMEVVDNYTLHSTYAAPVIILSHYLLAVVYPNTERGSTTREDTAVILGVGAGILSGAWVNQRYMLSAVTKATLPMMITLPSVFMLALCIARFIVGMIVLLFVKVVAKALAVYIVSQVITKEHPDTDRKVIPTKFITYSSVGITAVCICPAVMQFIGLSL